LGWVLKDGQKFPIQGEDFFLLLTHLITTF
jgi:hypothetical protein